LGAQKRQILARPERVVHVQHIAHQAASRTALAVTKNLKFGSQTLRMRSLARAPAAACARGASRRAPRAAAAPASRLPRAAAPRLSPSQPQPCVPRRRFLARAAPPDGSSAPPEGTAVLEPAASREAELECVATGTEVECVLPEGAFDAPAEADTPLWLLLCPFFFWGTSVRARRREVTLRPHSPLCPQMVCMKLVLPDTSPLFVASARLLPSGAALVAFSALRGRAQPSSPAAWAAVALFGLVDGTLFQGCLAQGLQRTSAGLGSVIIDSQPLTVALLAALLFGERVGGRAVVGLLIGVAGLLVLELPAPPGGVEAAEAAAVSAWSALASPSAGSLSLWDRGEWWMLLAAQAMAVGTVMVRWVLSLGVDAVAATGWHLVLGGLPLLALSLHNEPELYERLGTSGLPALDVAALAYASLLGGGVAYAAFFSAASRGSLVRLSSLTFLTPVFAASAGFLVLNETLTPQQLCGAAITLAGIGLVTVKTDADAQAK
jgi:drug/metabolite transporter (DMT)-like permease